MNAVYIIAEAGVNHNGSLELAKKLVDVAAEAGADAVKFQTFKAEQIAGAFAPKADYQIKNTRTMESQLDMLKKLELNHSQFIELSEYCSTKGIEFMSSPFDLDSIDFLVNDLRISRLKIASGEITNAPLLLKAAQTGKHIILSTGMSTLGEVEAALGVLALGYINKVLPSSSPEIFEQAFMDEEAQKVLRDRITLLHCTTEYPAPFDEVNLRAMDTLKRSFNLPVGYSDHTEGITIAIAAVAGGARVIEKHFTLDRSLPGPDHQASLEPGELKDLIKNIRRVELALGSGLKGPSKLEWANRRLVRKSLVAAQAIKAGEVFSQQNMACKRPGTGISPMRYWELLGRVAERDYDKDEQVE